ncbi:MAG: hypothetical protein OEV14_05510 [Gammaproteobacteria bacterium]|nr:hypothetical protein [Gammaproteobacteria bacterium]
MSRASLLVRSALLCLASLLAQASTSASEIALRFELDVAAGKSLAAARIVVRQSDGALREIVLAREGLQKVSGDGEITVSRDMVRWLPPAAGGGTLRYQVALSHRRQGENSPGNDAWVGERFALFRGENAFPIRSWRRARGSAMTGDLSVGLPKRWSLITPYLPNGLGRMPIHNPGTRLPRPIGWIIAGDLGTRRDFIDKLEITVTAPRGLRMERVALLGLLRWTLPQLLPALYGPASPRYINIVAAAEPMWLGALSAPNSIFVHAQRPLISENGTSTIVHEMVHVLLMDLETPRDQDWIDEGLAEFLSLRALKDSGTISASRYDAAVAGFRRRGESVKSLRTRSSKGAVTARAVAVFHDLDEELRRASKGRQSVATVVSGLLRSKTPADPETLRAAARRVIGRPARALVPAALPGLD